MFQDLSKTTKNTFIVLGGGGALWVTESALWSHIFSMYILYVWGIQFSFRVLR
jgi:hypothetical protein